MSEYNLQMLKRNCGHGDMLERSLVNCDTNPAEPRDCFVQRDEAERELDGVCSNCKQARRQLKIVQAKRKELVDSAKARRQEASSKVI